MKIKEDNHEDDIQLILNHLHKTDNTGVIHVGAHRGEEVDAYLRAGFQRILLIEANPRLHEHLLDRFAEDQRIQVFNCAISDHDGFVDFYLHTSRAGSVEPASILPLKRFKEIVRTLHTPESLSVPCHSLDSFLELNGIPVSEFSLLNIDVQGAEMLVLKGAQRALRSIPAVISEVSLIELYSGSALEQEITEFITSRGFRKVESIYHTLYDHNSSFPAWGECLFLKLPGDSVGDDPGAQEQSDG